jgi:signal peptidase I
MNTPSRAMQIWRQFRSFAFIFVILFAVRSSIADWNIVPSGSMIPTILEGDRIFVNKLAYDLKVPFTTKHLLTWDNPARGDVIVFFSPADGTRLVKRVIAVPGDQIELRDDHLFLNGVAATYQAPSSTVIGQLNAMERNGHLFAGESEPTVGAVHPVAVTPSLAARRWFGPVIVPAGQFFVMGDNRDNSFDSRYFGFVPRDCIVGRAVGVVASLDINHYWRPRWDRFFSLLP